jgi:hypothetical protein
VGIQEVVRESCDYPASLIKRWEEAVALNINMRL